MESCKFVTVANEDGFRAVVKCMRCGRKVRVSLGNVGPIFAACRGDAGPMRQREYGPGTELKKLLEKIGVEATPNCSCNARARVMDERGIEWCENNLDHIVGWLREEATNRGLPFVDMAGRMLVKRAIRNAKRA